MTPQNVFDQVKAHLLHQNARSLLEEGSCAYRGINGLTCAVGCLIEDDEYFPNMECQAIKTILANPLTKKSLVDRLKPHENLLSDLQKVHDQQPPSMWKSALDAVATKFGLKG